HAPLVKFLAGQAARHGLENSKASFEAIQRNIEGRIFRDTVANKYKILSNYPQQDITLAILLAVLGMDDNRDAFRAIVDAMLAKATAVDGLTGEKGLANYSAFAITALATFLGEFSAADPDFLRDAMERFPNLKKTYRFHIDTHCLDRYYPLSGDTGVFAAVTRQYKGMNVSMSGPGVGGWTAVQPSSYTLLWHLYKLTGDVAYVQTMVRMNGGRIEQLPYDLRMGQSDAMRKEIRRVIDREGSRPAAGSVNYRDWHLAILRSGQDTAARALWLDYDSGGPHGHQDGMNLGLFAYGLDLMPDFGYPPVQYGGWDSPRARWYSMSAGHNTVVVDGKSSPSGAGKTTLWANGKFFHAIRASGPALNHAHRFERTAALVDVAPDAFYVVDVFRVEGGSDHTKFMHSHFGTVETRGLQVRPGPDYGHGTQMRSFRWDRTPTSSWHIDWKIDDRYGLLSRGKQVRLRYTDLTTNAEAGVAEGWVVAGGYDTGDEAWIPRVLTRRGKQDDADTLRSTFVALIDPYEGEPTVVSAERLVVRAASGRVMSDSYVALAIVLPDGGRDVLVFRDPEANGPTELVVTSEPEVRTDADVALVRFQPDGHVSYLAIAHGTHLNCGDVAITSDDSDGVYERCLQPLPCECALSLGSS
ncbi:MAG: heparinase II/III family protein, partial [Pirellulales bacterium]